MTSAAIDKRLRSLEAQVAALQGRLSKRQSKPLPWWEQIQGVFSGDPAFDLAMSLGGTYRRQPKPAGRGGGNGRAGHSRH